MTVYLIYDIEITDEEAYNRYKPAAAQSIMAHGGEILVAAADADTLEGSWKPTWLVVIRFDSREAAQAWMDSEDYKPWKELRRSASTSRAVMAKSRGG